MADFFLRNIVEVFFFYGLSFFCMGVVILLEISHSSELDFGRALRPLGLFGMIHGSHEWFEMFLLLHPEITQGSAANWIVPLRLGLLASSFMMLLAFGARLITGPTRSRTRWMMLTMVIGIWIIGLVWVGFSQPAGTIRAVAADVYTRYSLAIPGAILTAWGLLLERQRFNKQGLARFSLDITLAAVTFSLYGVIGQLFASPSVLFPSIYLNSDAFVRWFGFPIQVFRAIMAALSAVFIIRSLRAFAVENQQQLETMREAQMSERRRLEETRAVLLRRTVNAQEAERQRIAHELHDETGQTLTALELGLHGLAQTIQTNPDKAVQQAQKLEGLAVAGIDELQRLVSGLHPPQLDDLGLLAALRWYAQETSIRFDLPVTVSSRGQPPGSTDGKDLPPEVRIVVFRIAQEAITNVIRHAKASKINVLLNYSKDSLSMAVEDDGQGFDSERLLQKRNDQHSWGLLGMIERATLAGGECQIYSQPGRGTIVNVIMPLIEKEE